MVTDWNREPQIRWGSGIFANSKKKKYSAGEHRLRLHGAEAETEPVLPEVIPDRKAKAADDNEKHDGDVDHRVSNVPAQ